MSVCLCFALFCSSVALEKVFFPPEKIRLSSAAAAVVCRCVSFSLKENFQISIFLFLFIYDEAPGSW
jgi:hypothetical protein